jgi:hypothetical protein
MPGSFTLPFRGRLMRHAHLRRSLAIMVSTGMEPRLGTLQRSAAALQRQPMLAQGGHGAQRLSLCPGNGNSLPVEESAQRRMEDEEGYGPQSPQQQCHTMCAAHSNFHRWKLLAGVAWDRREPMPEHGSACLVLVSCGPELRLLLPAPQSARGATRLSIYPTPNQADGTAEVEPTHSTCRMISMPSSCHQ